MAYADPYTEITDPSEIDRRRAEQTEKEEERGVLRTPAEWGEFFGMTGIDEAEWQFAERINVWDRDEGTNNRWWFLMGPTWDRRITSSTFTGLIDGSYVGGFELPKVEVVKVTRSGYKSTTMDKVRPKAKYQAFVPTEESVRDAVTSFEGWVSTNDIVLCLARPIGYTEALPKLKSKVTPILKALVAERVLVLFDGSTRATSTDHVGPHVTRSGNAGNEYTTQDQLDEWRVLRDEDQAEEARRENVVVDFSRDHLHGQNLGFKHARNRFNPKADDRSYVTIDWADFEALTERLRSTP